VARETGLIVFDSTNMALRAERSLKDAGIPCSVIPTPLEISTECGIALLVHGEWAEKASATLDASSGLVYRLIHPYEKDCRSGEKRTGGEPVEERLRLTSYSRRAG
jgi:hypothetical protein